jgi:hypothetical protein
MKYVKMLGLLAVAAAALMAFAGTASASTTTLTSGGTAYTGEIAATSTNGELDGAFVTVKCGHSEAKGTVAEHGGAEAKGTISSLTFTSCNYETTVKNAGSLAINGTGNGVKSSGAEVSIHTSVGTCVFTTNSTTVGTLTDSSETGGKAVLDINSSKIPRTGGNFLCGSSGTWTGNYTVNTPANLVVD